MTATQPNAKAFNPNQLALTRVASYERLIGAPLTRVWENVLDWEHLPHLHHTSFGPIEVDKAGDWGWRTWSNPARTDHIELTIASDDSYVARTYIAGKQVSEIWTRLTPINESVMVKVDFHLPDVAEESADKLGELMLNLYTRLWDEDEDMMQVRQRRLTESRDSAVEKKLGTEQDIRAMVKASGQYDFELGRRAFSVREVAGELVAHQSICPHLLGPLNEFDEASDTLRCPWHGYQFDVASGQCISPDTATCSLGPSPTLSLEEGDLIARMG